MRGRLPSNVRSPRRPLGRTTVRRRAPILGLAALLIASAGSSVSHALDEVPSASELLAGTDIGSGVAVLVGPGLEPAVGLAGTGRWIVHLLVSEAKEVPKQQDEVVRRGLGGRIVVAELRGARLPHPDRFANLVAVDLESPAGRALGEAEVRRIVALRGAARVRQGGTWRTLGPAQGPRLDDWTHHWYDATGNCVASDKAVGFPRAVQWQHGPAMEDGTSDGKIPRIAAGRWLAVDNRTGDLVCRDAGNGTLLWTVPALLAHSADIAVVEGRVYCHFDPRAPQGADPRRLVRPLVELDLTTGSVLRVLEEAQPSGTAKEVEFAHHEDPQRRDKRAPDSWFVATSDALVQAYAGELTVLDRASGKRRWTKTIDGASWFSPILAEGRVIAVEAPIPARRSRYDGTPHARAIAAFDVRDGRALWRTADVHPNRPLVRKGLEFTARADFKPLCAADGLVLAHVSSYQFREGGSLAVLEAATGKILWRREYAPAELYTDSSQRAVFRNGEVVLMDGTGAFRYDARTGEPQGDPVRLPKEGRKARQNGACTSSRATLDWLICHATLYVGPDGAAQACFGARGACGEGVVPAAGLIFVPPTPCDCGDYVRGWQALSATVPGRPIPEEGRLEPGPTEAPPSRPEAASRGWPIFLGDPQRRSATQETLPTKLVEAWRTRTVEPRADAVESDRRTSERHLGALGAPTASDGLVCVPLPEAHRVVALDAQTGTVRWSVTTGGKVDSPPTLADGLAVFGCDDGSVTAVRTSDGRVAWRHRLAPTDGTVLSHGHFASTHPVPGSVLVLGAAVVACTGQHVDLGGLCLRVLDLRTGRVRHERTIRADQPAVATNTLPVADEDGRGFWIGRQIRLGLDLTDRPIEPLGWPVNSLDRHGDRMRFRSEETGRGGSTHGWKGAMASGNVGGHRLAIDGAAAWRIVDPTANERHPVRVNEVPLLTYYPDRSSRERTVGWTASIGSLGAHTSYGALVKAGDVLVLGGGPKGGGAGFVQLVSAKDGKRLSEHPVPARVTECGLAIADGRLLVSCEDGHVVCFSAAVPR